MQNQGRLTWWYQFNSLMHVLDLDNITVIGFQIVNLNKTIWLLQKPIVWTDVCNAENVRLSVLLNKYHKWFSSAVLCKFPSSLSTTEELQGCSITLQINSQKEYNMESSYMELYFMKKKSLTWQEILWVLQMKTK